MKLEEQDQQRVDIFAAMAMQGLMANPSAMVALNAEPYALASKAMEFAIAMLNEVDCVKARAAK